MPENPAVAQIVAADRSDLALMHFLLNSPAARATAGSLRSGAEIAMSFTDLDGDWRIYRDDAGAIAFESGKALDPDFALRMPPRAVRSICSQLDADAGDMGVAFFEHIVSRDPQLKIQVALHSGLLKLTRRGWLSALTRGGSKIVMWLATKGLRGPGAIATALQRLKS